MVLRKEGVGETVLARNDGDGGDGGEVGSELVLLP